MQKLRIILIALILPIIFTSSSIMRRNDRSVETMWEEYHRAESLDRVRKMADILAEIKDKSLKQRKSWDYFKAAEMYVNVSLRRDWKLRDSLQDQFEREIYGYDEPVLAYILNSRNISGEELWETVRKDALRLKSAHNEDIYIERNRSFAAPVSNDYEYVLWDMFRTAFGRRSDILDKAYLRLKEEIGEQYPQAGIAEYHYVMHMGTDAERKKRLEDMLERYEGQAVGLLPAMSLLEMEFKEHQHKGDSGYFRSLRRRLDSYEKERSMYRRGVDKRIADDCTLFRFLMRHLDAEAVLVKVRSGKAEIALRNLDKVRIRITDENEEVYETVLENDVRSYYAFDTLRLQLPSLDDGDYTIRCFSGSRELGECHYPRYTLSAAIRADKDGYAVYVADYQSGKPVDAADVCLYGDGRKIAEARNLRIDGFTGLPENIASVMTTEAGCHIVCSVVGEDGRIRRSQDIYPGRKPVYDRPGSEALSAEVMLDRAAFRPGDTVRFKVVAYVRNDDGTMKVAEEGKSLSVSLRDPRGAVLEEREMKVNGFGSLAGEFRLNDIKRQGGHRIEVRVGSILVGSYAFIVDEFVLPTFDVAFDENDVTYFSGDTISVSGKVQSFSGHSLASAKVTAYVRLDDILVKDEELAVGEDGSFVFSFADLENVHNQYIPYRIEVKVTDQTGETLSFFTTQYVMRSPSLAVTLQNTAEGSYRLVGNNHRSKLLLTDDTARVSFNIRYGGVRKYLGQPVRYKVFRDECQLVEGEAVSGNAVDIDFTSLPSGLYSVKADFSLADARGKIMEDSAEIEILKMGDDLVPDKRFENIFCELEEGLGCRLGVGNGPVWAVVELFGDRGQLLESEVISVEGGDVGTVRYEHTGEYPDAVEMKILYFRDSQCYTYSRRWHRPVEMSELPLEFVRFEDRTMPGARYSFRLRTEPDAEVLAAIFDLSTEKIKKNIWRKVPLGEPYLVPVRVNPSAGLNGSGHSSMMGDAIDMYNDGYLFETSSLGKTVIGYGSPRRVKARSAGAVNSGMMAYDDMAVEEEAIPFQLVTEQTDVALRSDFATSLAFEPFLRPSSDGSVSLDFNTSGKISTFAVSVYAHNKQMNTSVMRRDMLVTLPVKVSVAEPQFLYSGDKYVMKASVSNISSSSADGVVRLEVYAGNHYEDAVPLSVCETKVEVSAGGSVPVSFDVPVPDDVDCLGFKVVFSGKEMSDGVFVKVPVYPAEQVLTEAHSAVLLEGRSEEELLESLRKEFVNVSPTGAEYSEISVMDMLREALPSVTEPEAKDAVSLSEAFYVNLLACGLRMAEGDDPRPYVQAAGNVSDRMIMCANSDGGFGWFAGMKSSPAVTAVVLERFAGLRDRGLLDVVTETLGEDALDKLDETVVAAVKYLDSVYFSDPDRPSWYGRLSMSQYLGVRTMYAGIPFDAPKARKSLGIREYKEFMKQVKSYLIHKKDGIRTDGAVLSKVRKIRILNQLSSSEAGLQMAESWGLGASAKKRMRRSMAVELESLKEYAVMHPSGGLYYPNAVLPFRGLLESEAYAHGMICDLFKELSTDPVHGSGLEQMADDIRLWIMLQKETQQWSSDPGFVEALASAYDASDAVKAVRIMVLSKKYCKPFGDIEASGNGFGISVRYYREKAPEGGQLTRTELVDGDQLCVGDKIVAVYSLWSEENRSFVRISVPRAACFRPQNQISGWSGGWLRPLSYGFFNVSPYAYREVKSDRTLYWIDVFPEETSVMEEILVVTQEGRFVSPVAEIESLYASHYRANSPFAGEFETE